MRVIQSASLVHTVKSQLSSARAISIEAMKIFISSLMAGFEAFRQAARSAVETLRHEAVMAEDFGAQPNSPQVACLQGIRASDLVILILGDQYGTVQGSSGVSPTHEEYLEARDRKPILMFVQEGVSRDPKQSSFISEAQAWQGGLFRESFQTAEQLNVVVTRAIHDYELSELSRATGPLDKAVLTKNATDLLPKPRPHQQSGSPMLNVAVVGGPTQRILRPAELAR